MPYGDRPAALANDLTKLFERVDRGPLSQLLAEVTKTEPKGEYVLVVAGVMRKRDDAHPADDSAEDAE
jgi:16S rRNA (cytidine1402-2'-O)-methyltransferase